ncbi:nucleoside transporter [Purpureocillium lavendulum]|uniref:Nucleoside transporter n=1 Tax=Purpureocillium lavendulum TaxID=1247861 RepID=A0AB34G6Q8_9HYPO|nr:nucleoside transporter [Purpureocillium lavendulum]
MDRPARAEYEPLTAAEDDGDHDGGPEPLETSTVLDGDGGDGHAAPFSWIEYGIFAFLGVAMLWAWNMFLAAAPYFAFRLAGNAWAEANFQSAILTVSTLTNLSVLLILTNVQQSASYPFRINSALVINSVVFMLLTCSTTFFLDASPGAYLGFLLSMVACSAVAMALIQNGAFAFAASFGRPEYMQALMAGQGVAGVLPAVAQVVAVLLFPPPTDNQSEPSKRSLSEGGETSAFLYFLAAVVISVTALFALVPLVRRHNRIVEGRLADQMAESMNSIEAAERAARKVTSLWALFLKLRWLAPGVALTFTVTMFFPVFTAKIRSVQEDSGLLFKPPVFIPLGFFFWNLGDLGGRMATMLPFSLQHRPVLLFALAALRIGQLPLYLLCNIGGKGAVISSDFFYLFVVQLFFGLTNGWLGSSFMMASGKWVDEGEREATGGFMGLFLVLYMVDLGYQMETYSWDHVCYDKALKWFFWPDPKFDEIRGFSQGPCPADPFGKMGGFKIEIVAGPGVDPARIAECIIERMTLRQFAPGWEIYSINDDSVVLELHGPKALRGRTVTQPFQLWSEVRDYLYDEGYRMNPYFEHRPAWRDGSLLYLFYQRDECVDWPKFHKCTP